MFNKKRNAARKQQRLEQRAQAENRAIADIAAAQAIADPAARLLKLAEIENHIATHVAAVAAAAGAYRGHAVVAGGALAAGGVLAVIVALPHLAMPAMILMGSSAFSLEIGGMAGQGAHDDRRVKAQMAEVADHLKKMAAFTQQVAEMKETLVRDQAEGISRSPFYERVLNLPGL
ncbi:MAG: hypothetical protein KGQ70_07075, partial [Alphaproteobacteria bacterium]|nr:hypothetical protein [Alphaproteobacteria bacterium]